MGDVIKPQASRNHALKNQSGITLVEVVVAVGILGLVIIGAAQVTKNYDAMHRKLEIVGETEDLRNQFRARLSCSKTMSALGDQCKGKTAADNFFISVLQENGDAIVGAFPKVFNLGAAAALRATCIDADSYYNLNVQYRRQKSGKPSIDPLTEKASDWRNLFPGAPIACTKSPDAEINDNILTINKKISRVDVSTVLDHMTDFVVEQGRVYFTHKLLGFPEVTMVTFYDTDGKVIDTKSFTPQFKVGQGANCPVIGYCAVACSCISTPIILTQGHTLRGLLSFKRGRGFVGPSVADGGKTVVVSAYDCGRDCGSPAGGRGLSGKAAYNWVIQ